MTQTTFSSDTHNQVDENDALQNISDDIEVEPSYRGVHLTFPLTLNQLHKMVQAFRRKQVFNTILRESCMMVCGVMVPPVYLVGILP